MVPIIIGFLASAIGLGGIGAKIKSIIETLQKPVNKALDWVIKKGLTLAGPIIKAAKGVGAKVKAKVAAGKAWVKGKVEAGKRWVKGKAAAIKAKVTGGPADPKEAAIKAAGKALRASKSHADADRRLTRIRDRYKVPLNLVVERKDAKSEHVHVQTMKTDSVDIPAEEEEDTEAAASLFESVAGETMADYLDNFANWRTPRPGQEMGQTRAVPVHLSEKSVENNRTAVERFVGRSPASAARKTTALESSQRTNRRRSEFAGRSLGAPVPPAGGLEGPEALRRTRGVRAGRRPPHRRARPPGTFVRSKITRTYGAIVERIRKNKPSAKSREEIVIADMKAPLATKREIARMYAEHVVEKLLGDVGETDRNTEPREIELLIITKSAHAAATARRAGEEDDELSRCCSITSSAAVIAGRLHVCVRQIAKSASSE